MRSAIDKVLKKVTDRIGRGLLRLLTNEVAKEEANTRLGRPEDSVEDATDTFLKQFYSRTKIYGPVVSVALFVILVVDGTICTPIPSQIYGLTLDILGAIILGRGLLKGPYSIAMEAASYYQKSPPRENSLAQDLTDGVWGISLLVVGVGLQFVAVAGLFPAITVPCVM